MIFILLQVTYTLQDNETITGDSSETVDVASILALNDLVEETTITVSNDEEISNELSEIFRKLKGIPFFIINYVNVFQYRPLY